MLHYRKLSRLLNVAESAMIFLAGVEYTSLIKIIRWDTSLIMPVMLAKESALDVPVSRGLIKKRYFGVEIPVTNKFGEYFSLEHEAI